MNVDNEYMGIERKNRREAVIQWIGVLIAVVGLAYNGLKDYQKGEIKIPKMPQQTVLTKPVYPVQYCLMAYDPNIDKVFYLHENGQWYDYAPQQRRYSATPQSQQQGQGQGKEAVGSSYGSQGASGYGHGQPPQAAAYPARY